MLPEKKAMTGFLLVRYPQPDGSANRALDELESLLRASLLDNGFDVEQSDSAIEGEGTVIAMNAHRLEDASQIPDDSIVFNTEQLMYCRTDWRQRIEKLARRCMIWDYAAENIAYLRSAVEMKYKPVCLGLGYHRCLERIERKPDPAGLAFFGSMTAKRVNTLELLRQQVQVECFFHEGIYGVERDLILGRCAAGLNIAAAYPSVLEWPRLLYMIINRIPVICLTETGCSNYLPYKPYFISFSERLDYSDMSRLALDHPTLARQADQAYSLIKCQPQTSLTALALYQSQGAAAL